MAMISIEICGLGAVSPAGWNVAALADAIAQAHPLPPSPLPGHESLLGRFVPTPEPRPRFLSHPRMRRSSAIAQFAVGAALEALSEAGPNPGRVGLFFCTMCGPIRYTRRFFAETLTDPTTASPLLFPETVFNAPSSHLAALLGQDTPACTFIGDSSVFLQGLAIGADWLVNHQLDTAIVIAAEELDWTAATAWQPFCTQTVLSEGAGALCLRRGPSPAGFALLDRITDPWLYLHRGMSAASTGMYAQLGDPAPHEWLCDGQLGIPAADHAESHLTASWTGPRVSPKSFLGEGLTAATAWQCVVAAHAVRHHRAPSVRICSIGCNQQAVGARFVSPKS
jgi:3-oxoacyl-(acyl-carrier-protein) synthase